MNEVLFELYERFKHLRTMQEIVEEIEIMDYYVYNYNETEAIRCIDFCVGKYGDYINYIMSAKRILSSIYCYLQMNQIRMECSNKG